MNDDQLYDLKQFIDSKISQSEARLRSEISDTRVELKGDIAELREELSELREETQEGFRGVAVAFEELNTQQEKLRASDKRQENLIGKLTKSVA